MRYLLFIVVLFTFSIGLVAAQDAAQDAVIEFSDHPARVVTNINALNMRSSPAIEANNIVGRLQPGQQVHVLAREGAWQQVRREDGPTAWAHSDYLIDLPARQLGESRLFLLEDSLMDSPTLVHADLRHIGQHSYIYFAEHSRQSNWVNLNEVRAFAKAFDEHIYPETIALWDPDPKPSHEGDERIVILFTVGYKNNTGALAGLFHNRSNMPGELHPYSNRTGFIEMTWHNGIPPDVLHHVVAHELQHLTQHHFDIDEHSWVHEGFSVFNSAYLGYLEYQRYFAVAYLDLPNAQLNEFTDANCDYGSGFLLATYILEQLGLEALRDFVRRPENGLAALDVVLAERGGELDTESFFADFVLANYLLDPNLSGGRFGYQMLRPLDLPKPYVNGLITDFPTRIHESLSQYATEYYEIALPESDQAIQLELTLQFPDSPSLDGWLQLVQVVDGEVSLQRFRASEYRNQMMSATLQPNAEQAFLAISPFRTGARYITAAALYTIQIQRAGSDAASADYATFAPAETTDLADLATLTENTTPFQLAIEVSRVIHEYAKNNNRLLVQYKTAEIDQYVARVKELLAAGADLSKYSGEVLVTVLGKIKSPELLALLLDAGANPNTSGLHTFSPGEAQHINFTSSPLNYAVFYQDAESVQLLLAAGARVNTISWRASTLHLASIRGNIRIIELLLAAGADPNFKAAGGRTPTDFARQYGHHTAAQVLEAAAAN